MSGLSNVIKGGWHPKGKEGGKESWRGDFKGINQVAGWMGKGKKPGSGDDGGSGHMSKPLATLKDPSLFGPPPKNVNYHGGAALPNQITPHTGGLGAPLSRQEIEAAERAVQRTSTEQREEEEEEEIPTGPPLPYRADRTGLKTDHLPPPPIHRDLHHQPDEPAQNSIAAPKPKPGLPPRLPARTNSSNAPIPVASPPAQPPSSERVSLDSRAANKFLNQNAASRLAKAGVSVPGIGVGEANPWSNERTLITSTVSTPPAIASPPLAVSSPPPSSDTPSQLSELQARFARMTSKPATTTQPQSQAEPRVQSPQLVQTTSPPAEGTTMAQKQAAFQTAQNFHRDPNTVTLADAKSAASTANNFRERHQDQISASATKANTWNKKFNVTGRLGNFLEKQVSPVSEQPPTVAIPSQVPIQSNPSIGSPPPATPELHASLARKPPPPPPPKKPAGMHAPPPVPFGTKPSFA